MRETETRKWYPDFDESMFYVSFAGDRQATCQARELIFSSHIYENERFVINVISCVPVISGCFRIAVFARS